MNAQSSLGPIEQALEQRTSVSVVSTVLDQIMHTIGACPPESGGILLGPVHRREVTDFFFDTGGTCTGATYTPDHRALGEMMRHTWLPNGLDMKGMVHSHPKRAHGLSRGDLTYIARLLQANKDMDRFIAPIVLPDAFRLHAFVVLRERAGAPVTASLQIIE